MVSSRAVPYLLLLAGVLGLISLSGRTHAQPPPQKDAECEKAACNKKDDIEKHPSCPIIALDIRETCKFDKALGDLIWCKPLNTKSCEIESGQPTNKCKGYCFPTTGITCYGTEYNKCVIPAPDPGS